MAKKASKKKTSKSGTAAKKTSSKRSTAKKATSKKSAARPAKKATKKKPGKKTSKKVAAKKKASKKNSAQKSTAKKAAAKKSPPKKAPKKSAAKKPAAKKATAKKATAKAAPTKKAEASKPGQSKSGRKGITIVTPKQTKKAKAPKKPPAIPALTGSILGMGLGSGKPLIPSGPKAPAIGGAEGALAADGKKPKSPFNKRQLDKYREILLRKRAELLGDIDSMENEALKSQSGSLSHLPQHMAEQGSETYEQSLSLDLAAADRVLLREIDAALQRIADRTYGLCERTGKAISTDRLAELPWARYSIEAAREMERRSG